MLANTITVKMYALLKKKLYMENLTSNWINHNQICDVQLICDKIIANFDNFRLI